MEGLEDAGNPGILDGWDVLCVGKLEKPLGKVRDRGGVPKGDVIRGDEGEGFLDQGGFFRFIVIGARKGFGVLLQGEEHLEGEGILFVGIAFLPIENRELDERPGEDLGKEPLAFRLEAKVEIEEILDPDHGTQGIAEPFLLREDLGFVKDVFANAFGVFRRGKGGFDFLGFF